VTPNRGGPAVEVEGLSRRFGDFTALDHVDLTIREGEFFSLLGPSGCGKTTLLRILAGLDLPDEGTVRIGGVDAGDIPPHRRPVNTVFQSYALFPHMTVRDNVAFGLRMKRVPPAALAERVDRALDMVQIEHFADRKPAQLSGGQKQRVALARAFINEPEVLLLDEPLGALDLKLRKELQVELSALQKRLGITFVFVTHDQEEALVMSDRIAVMRAGKIEQLGEAHALYERPRNRFVGQFLGSCNLLLVGIAVISFLSRGTYGEIQLPATLSNYKRLAGFGLLGFDPQYLQIILRSLVLGAGATLVCLLASLPLAFFIASLEGRRWVDNLAIPAKAPHLDAAEKFVNFILDAQVGARLSNFNQYATPNRASKAYVNPDDLKNEAIDPSDAMMGKLEFVNDLGDANKLYDEVWTQVKSK
jgi:ABC-type Fe3+/spermidine/putrescine transport system ATPase subunit